MVHPGWRYHPAAKIALLTATGIGAAELLRPKTEVLLLSTSLLLILISLFSRTERKIWVRLYVGSLALLIVLMGGLLYGTRGGYAEPLLPPGVTIERLNVVGVIRRGPRALKGGGVEWRVRPDSVWRRQMVARPESDLLVRLYRPTPDSHSLPEPGERVLLRGDFRTASPPHLPEEFDYGAWLQRDGVAGVVTMRRIAEMERLGPGELSHLDRLVESFRGSLRAYAGRHIGGEEGAIAVALLSGDRSGVSRDLRDSFSATGTAHVLALSGLHVGALALLLFVFLSWIPQRWVRFALFVACLGAYVLLTGGSPSILRASLMATFFLLAYTIGRISQPLNTLGLAGLVILLLDPLSLFDVGFQLSFAAVGGILLFYGRIYRFLDDRLSILLRFTLPRSIVQLLLLSFTAQLGTLPLTTLYFGEFSLLSLPLNVLVVPLITVGFGAAGCGYLLSWIPELASWYGASSWLAIGWVVDLVKGGSEVAWGSVRLPQVMPVVVLGALVGILWTGLAERVGSLTFRALIVIALVATPWLLEKNRGHLEHDLYIVPLTRRDGIALLERRGEELTLRYAPVRDSDSLAAVRILERYADLFEADRSRLIPYNRKGGAESVLLNHAGPEFLLESAPVLLSLTGRRELGRVDIAGASVLQVPLHGRVGGVRRIAP